MPKPSCELLEGKDSQPVTKLLPSEWWEIRKHTEKHLPLSSEVNSFRNSKTTNVPGKYHRTVPQAMHLFLDAKNGCCVWTCSILQATLWTSWAAPERPVAAWTCARPRREGASRWWISWGVTGEFLRHVRHKTPYGTTSNSDGLVWFCLHTCMWVLNVSSIVDTKNGCNDNLNHKLWTQSFCIKCEFSNSIQDYSSYVVDWFWLEASQSKSLSSQILLRPEISHFGFFEIAGTLGAAALPAPANIAHRKADESRVCTVQIEKNLTCDAGNTSGGSVVFFFITMFWHMFQWFQSCFKHICFLWCLTRLY